MTPIEPLTPTPEMMGELWRQFSKRRHNYPNGLAVDVREFVALMTAPDTALYEVGNFGGIIYFTDIVDGDTAGLLEPRAASHVLIWDRKELGNDARCRQIARAAMERFKVYRLISEIPAFNRTAIAFAKRIGFHEVGVLRRRHKVAGAWEDSVVLDALRSDLRHAQEKQHGRHRRLRPEVGRKVPA